MRFLPFGTWDRLPAGTQINVSKAKSSRGIISTARTLNKRPPREASMLSTSYGLHPAPCAGLVAPRRTSAWGSLGPPVCRWRCLKSQPGLGLRTVFFSPKQPLWSQRLRLGPRRSRSPRFRGGPRPCWRPRPALLLSNTGWSRQPTVKMAPGRLRQGGHSGPRPPSRRGVE